METAVAKQKIAVGPPPLMRGAKIGLNLKIEIEKALEDGACHPEGIRGWLIDCARSTKTADRQIFAAIVAKLLPSHLVTSNQHNITINLGWLADRKVEQDQHVIDGVSEPTDVPTAERDGE